MACAYGSDQTSLLRGSSPFLTRLCTLARSVSDILAGWSAKRTRAKSASGQGFDLDFRWVAPAESAERTETIGLAPHYRLRATLQTREKPGLIVRSPTAYAHFAASPAFRHSGVPRCWFLDAASYNPLVISTPFRLLWAGSPFKISDRVFAPAPSFPRKPGDGVPSWLRTTQGITVLRCPAGACFGMVSYGVRRLRFVELWYRGTRRMIW